MLANYIQAGVSRSRVVFLLPYDLRLLQGVELALSKSCHHNHDFAGGAEMYKTGVKDAVPASQVQRQRQTGIQLAMQIVQKEGLKGLYRGFGASIATFVPSSAIW